MAKDKKIREGLIVCDSHEFEVRQGGDGRFDLCVALAGEWKSRDLTVTEKELRQMADNFALEQRDILFDYDHKCLGGFFDPGDSRAAGWGKSLEIREGALWVSMEPTPRGREAIEAGEFRYLSPVYEYQRQDRVTGKTLKDWRLHSVALTNTPYLTELPAIKNTEQVGGNNMDELMEALSSETEEEALAKVQELRDNLNESEATIQALQAQLGEAEIDRAIADKKLLPAQKPLAQKLMAQSRELYDEFIANAAVPDLTKEVEVKDGGDDGLDPLAKITSFKQLTADPELAKRMEQENPERFNELYNTFVKEGK
jgi:phage I-like protein